MMQGRLHNYIYMVINLVITCWTQTFAYNTGAPRETCVSMTPGHVGEETRSPPPFRIRVEPAEYSPHHIVLVTLTTCLKDVEGFKGFILQARLASGDSTTPIGVFNTPSMTQSVRGCGTALKQAVTHTSNFTKTDLTFEWSHPAAKGHVVMVATFVHSYSRFWRNVYSEVIYDSTQTRDVAAPYFSMYPTPSTCQPVAPSTNAPSIRSSPTSRVPKQQDAAINNLEALEEYKNSSDAFRYGPLLIVALVFAVFV